MPAKEKDMKVTKKTRWGKSALMLVFVLALLVGLVLAGCLDPGSDSSSGGNPFVGTWYGFFDGDRIRVVVDETTWTMSWTDYSWWGNETGTYMHSGNTATFYQDGYAIGMATVTGNSITANSSEFSGTVILTKFGTNDENDLRIIKITNIPTEYLSAYSFGILVSNQGGPLAIGNGQLFGSEITYNLYEAVPSGGDLFSQGSTPWVGSGLFQVTLAIHMSIDANSIIYDGNNINITTHETTISINQFTRRN